MTIPEPLAAGLVLLAGWLEWARDTVQRIGAQALEPLLRLAGEEPRPPAPPESDAPPPGRPQVEVEEAKYYLGPVHETPPPTADRFVDREPAELPRSYGEDTIVLLPRDPWWLFAYWEVTPSTRVQALRVLGGEAEGASEVLRVYDVTFITFTGHNAWRSWDVELPPGAESWYLNVGRPATSFCVEIGLRTPSGRFLPLARSNVVTTPRAAPSSDMTVRWAELGRGAARETEGRWRGGRVAGADGPGIASSPARSSSSDVHAPEAAR